MLVTACLTAALMWEAKTWARDPSCSGYAEMLIVWSGPNVDMM